MSGPSTDLIALKSVTALDVFSPGAVEDILTKITNEVRVHEPDISTPSGRSAVASLAYKVARAKTALDDLGKDLVAEWKGKASAVDAERRTLRERLDALKDEVRKPLTDWENAEKTRVTDHEAALSAIAALGIFDVSEPPLAEIERRILAMAEQPPREWQEFGKRASETMAAVLAKLTDMRNTAVMREAERAELARLRSEQAERERAERDAKIAAAATERARLEAEAAAKVEADKAEQARLKVEREKADALARAEKAEADRKAAEAKAENDKRAAAAKAERDQAAAVEAERKRAADAAAAEQVEAARREANKKHVAKINNEVADAFCSAGLTREQAVVIITAIARGEVPHTKISY